MSGFRPVSDLLHNRDSLERRNWEKPAHGARQADPPPLPPPPPPPSSPPSFPASSLTSVRESGLAGTAHNDAFQSLGRRRGIHRLGKGVQGKGPRCEWR